MSSKKVILKADKRKVLGRKVKKIRREGILPANLYGKKVKSTALQLPFKEFEEVYKKVGETQLVELSISGEKSPRHVLIHNVQTDPVSGHWLHADFRQVDLTEKIETEVPIALIGEAPAVNKGGVLVQMINEVTVEALPTDLPEKFELDVAGLNEINDALSFKDLKIDKSKVKLVVESEDELVVKIEEPTKEEEKPVEKPAEEEAAEGEEVKEGEEAKPAEEGEEEKKETKEQPPGEDKTTKPADSEKAGKPITKPEEKKS